LIPLPKRDEAVRAQRVMVIYNPTAGRRRRRRLDAVVDALARRGVEVTLRATTCRGDAERLAGEASADVVDRLVVAGGDGTINEAINGLRDRRLPVALVPLGTANVLAAELDLPPAADRLAAAIIDGVPRNVTVGRVNGRAFTMMAGIGFDAHVVQHVSLRLKRSVGKLAYVIETLRQLGRYRPTLYDVVVDGVRHRASSVIVANGRFYGGRFVCAPKARLESPEFQACLFGRAGRWHVVRYALALLVGRLHRLKDITILPARRVEIAAPAGEPVQGDGDTIAVLPARIEIASGTLRLIGGASRS
jgi:YegS/Rv2252/BmrU family lipid kinase